MPDRFVILHHRLDDGEHWDLMLEQGDVLLTWQLLRDPILPANYPIPARRIGDHRKAYLNYEGPLTGGRGTVRSVDSGSLVDIEDTAQGLRIVLAGKRLCGSFLLRKAGGVWILGAFETNPPNPRAQES